MCFKRPFLFVSTLLATLQTHTFALPGHRPRDGINERSFDHFCCGQVRKHTSIVLKSKVAQKWPYGQGGSNFRHREKTRVFT